MNRIPSIKSVMTPFPHFVEYNQPAARAVELMEKLAIRHLPVKKDGRLVSVVSERHIRFAEERGEALETLRVADVCSMGAYIVDLAEPLDRVLSHMASHHLGSALVVKDGRLAGIFTTTDACRHYAQLLRAQFGSDDDEDAA